VARYDAQIDLSNPNVSHSQVIDLVGRNKRVLDVGCATGYLARQLGTRGCTVSGIEVDEKVGEEARPDLEQLVVADLNVTSIADRLQPESFDVIVFADVLEHLLDPDRVLEESIRLLAPGGRIVISIPNVGHGALRLALLQGRWDYTDTGLLDRTHIRFFTRRSLLEMVGGAGLAIEQLRAVVVDPLASPVDLDAAAIPPAVIEWVRRQPDALHYQFVLSARKLEDGELAPEPPAVVPAIGHDQVRQHDRYTQMLLDEEAAKHRLLTTRDHLIGLEAELANAVARESATRAEAKRDVQRANRERRAIEQSRTWRAGLTVTRPLRMLRGRGKARS
jgi:2-polyprenyl-3-methyl-5-hydroxy-6-metoxy-1,4-benzoquinol methylase